MGLVRGPSGLISGDLAHTGAKAGVFGRPPIAQPAAFTQNYFIASRTHNAVQALSVINTAAVNVGAYGYSTQGQADAVVSELNRLRSDLIETKKVLNQVIDDLQAEGWLG